jgi:hypothetical protein
VTELEICPVLATGDAAVFLSYNFPVLKLIVSYSNLSRTAAISALKLFFFFLNKDTQWSMVIFETYKGCEYFSNLL